ncbi:MAG: hypothetical protein Ct9H300mP25_14850 [Acidobacteriota bacterium]|nr:MAG: hypothetical protein Ct9H300mP25_14850 [Acidobacteriota bacterium]
MLIPVHFGVITNIIGMVHGIGRSKAPLLIDIDRGRATIPALLHAGRNGYLGFCGVLKTSFLLLKEKTLCLQQRF